MFWRKLTGGCGLLHGLCALHQADRQAEVEMFFGEAEQMQQESQPDSPLLYSLRGFRYCDLLLAAHERPTWQSSARILRAGSPGILPGESGGKMATLRNWTPP